METAVRLILILLGVVILVGILWDVRRGRFSKKRRNELAFELENKEAIVSTFDDVRIIVKPEKQEPIFYREELITLNIMAREPSVFSGKKLKSAFAGAHLYYGERQIFHRFDNIDGTGQNLFSVVSMIEPGFFELAKIEGLETPGITLFFMTSTPNHSIYVFELMLRTAKQLALRLEGDVKDDQHRVLTPQIIEQYRERIRMQSV